MTFLVKRVMNRKYGPKSLWEALKRCGRAEKCKRWTGSERGRHGIGNIMNHAIRAWWRLFVCPGQVEWNVAGRLQKKIQHAIGLLHLCSLRTEPEFIKDCSLILNSSKEHCESTITKGNRKGLGVP